MFRGANAISIDSKGRLAIPARYRELLERRCAGRLVCTVELSSPCLTLYPLPEWEAIEVALQQLSSMDPTSNAVKQVLLGNARDLELDKAGRFLLPAELRGRAGLDKRIALVGMGNKFNIWDEERWNAHNDRIVQQVQQGQLDVSERLLSLPL